MSFEAIKKLLEQLKKIGIRSCILIGGEPTLHPNIIEIFKYGRSLGLNIGLVSNGVRFADPIFCKEFITAGLKSKNITLSMHASSPEDSFELTRSKTYFTNYSTGFKNLIANKIKPSINITISKANKYKLFTMMDWLKQNGKKEVHFNLGAPSVSSSGIDSTYVLSFKELAEITEQLYYYGKKIKVKTYFLFLIPFCALPRKIYNALKKNNLISYGCSIRTGTGIVFNTDGNVVSCNHLLDFPIIDKATFAKSVEDSKFEEQWQSPSLTKIRNNLCVYRLEKCKTCDELQNCQGGGCPLGWLNKPLDQKIYHWK